MTRGFRCCRGLVMLLLPSPHTQARFRGCQSAISPRCPHTGSALGPSCTSQCPVAWGLTPSPLLTIVPAGWGGGCRDGVGAATMGCSWGIPPPDHFGSLFQPRLHFRASQTCVSEGAACKDQDGEARCWGERRLDGGRGCGAAPLPLPFLWQSPRVKDDPERRSFTTRL